VRVSCLFASVHRVDGLALPSATTRLVLIEQPHIRALVGINLDDLCADLDVSRAVAVLTLRGTVGAETPAFNAALTSELKEITDRRAREGKNRVLLFIESRAEVDLDLSQPHKEAHGMVVGFDLTDRDTMVRQHQQNRRMIIASLTLAAGCEIDTHKLSEGLYCHDDTGKRYLSYTMTPGNIRAVLSTPPEKLSTIVDYLQRCEERKDLARIVRLAADAAAASDRFRVWQSAWTALESLITTRFGRYEQLFLEELRGQRTDAATAHYFSRVADVMGERYRLLDKFAIIASRLFPQQVDADVEDFKKLKKQRDSVMHGAELNDAVLRAEAVRELLRRYLDADLLFDK
jgi:hypothetical protein